MNQSKAVLNKIVSGDYEVYHYDELQGYINIAKVMDKYPSSTYVGEFSLPTGDGSWANQPVQIYWQDQAHPEGSNWFGLYFNASGSLCITNAIKASEVEWDGIVNENNEVIYSAYRHDYQKFKDLIADGGREYFRGSLHPHVSITLQPGGSLRVVPEVAPKT